jgi:hypothetical protein
VIGAGSFRSAMVSLIVSTNKDYEMAAKPLKRRPRTVRCRGCRKPIRVKGKGRIPTYCSQACKQEAYLKRRHRGPMELLAQDIATVRVRAVIRQEVMYCLTQLGLVSPGTPPPSKPKAKATALRIVGEGDH